MSKPKLLDQARDKIRRLNYAYSTEKAYLSWIKRFILYHDKRYPHCPGTAGACRCEDYYDLHSCA